MGFLDNFLFVFLLADLRDDLQHGVVLRDPQQPCVLNHLSGWNYDLISHSLYFFLFFITWNYHI